MLSDHDSLFSLKNNHTQAQPHDTHAELFLLSLKSPAGVFQIVQKPLALLRLLCFGEFYFLSEFKESVNAHVYLRWEWSRKGPCRDIWFPSLLSPEMKEEMKIREIRRNGSHYIGNWLRSGPLCWKNITEDKNQTLGCFQKFLHPFSPSMPLFPGLSPPLS